MPTPPFEKSVFLNCPFDETFAPILQAISFCIIDMGLYVRLAPENADNSAGRLERIVDIVQNSRYAIHDLSRCKSTTAGEYARLNMPFELGIDYGCQRFGNSSKSVLVLEETRFDYQKSLSDIAGWDIEFHNGDHRRAVSRVRNWLVKQANADHIGASLVLKHYADFQGWYWKRELERGASEDDIKEYPTIHVIDAMRQWFDGGRPV
jgi:hypothetical protein